MTRGGVGRHVDYDTPRDDVEQSGAKQLTTYQLIRAFMAKDKPVEVVRVPTHILDAMLHAEPVGEVIKEGEIDVTRINLTELRALLDLLEKRVERVPLSRWRRAVMAPVERIDLPQQTRTGAAPSTVEVKKEIEAPPPTPSLPEIALLLPTSSDAADDNPFDVPEDRLAAEEKERHAEFKRLGKLAKKCRTQEEKAAENVRKNVNKKNRKRRKRDAALAAGNDAAAAAPAAASAAPPRFKIPKHEVPQQQAPATSTAKAAPAAKTVPAAPAAKIAPAAKAAPAAPAAKARVHRDSKWDRTPAQQWSAGHLMPPHYQMDRSPPFDYRNDHDYRRQLQQHHFSAASSMLHQPPPPPPPSGSINYTRPVGYSDPSPPNNYSTRATNDSWIERPRQDEYYHDVPYYGFR